MQNEDTREKLVVSEEILKEIRESSHAIIKFISAEAELLTHLKLSYISKMLALVNGTFMYFMDMLRESVPENLYKEIVINVKENLKQILELGNL